MLYNTYTSYKDNVNIKTYESINELYQDDYESDDGTMYENVSDYFDYRIYPIELVPSNQGTKIVYHVIVFNKSDSDFKKARVILTLNDSMYKYIASGVLEYPMGEFDLFSINSPKRQRTNKFAHAIEATFEISLKEGLDCNIVNQDDYFVQIAREINVTVKWNKGSESQDFEIDFNE